MSTSGLRSTSSSGRDGTFSGNPNSSAECAVSQSNALIQIYDQQTFLHGGDDCFRAGYAFGQLLIELKLTFEKRFQGESHLAGLICSRYQVSARPAALALMSPTSSWMAHHGATHLRQMARLSTINAATTAQPRSQAITRQGSRKR